MTALLAYLLLFAFSPAICFLFVLAALVSAYAWVCLLAGVVRWVVR